MLPAGLHCRARATVCARLERPCYASLGGRRRSDFGDVASSWTTRCRSLRLSVVSSLQPREEGASALAAFLPLHGSGRGGFLGIEFCKPLADGLGHVTSAVRVLEDEVEERPVERLHSASEHRVVRMEALDERVA